MTIIDAAISAFSFATDPLSGQLHHGVPLQIANNMIMVKMEFELTTDEPRRDSI
jgi:hypothetical protein